MNFLALRYVWHGHRLFDFPHRFQKLWKCISVLTFLIFFFSFCKCLIHVVLFYSSPALCPTLSRIVYPFLFLISFIIELYEYISIHRATKTMHFEFVFPFYYKAMRTIFIFSILYQYFVVFFFCSAWANKALLTIHECFTFKYLHTFSIFRWIMRSFHWIGSRPFATGWTFSFMLLVFFVVEHDDVTECDTGSIILPKQPFIRHTYTLTYSLLFSLYLHFNTGHTYYLCSGIYTYTYTSVFVWFYAWYLVA